GVVDDELATVSAEIDIDIWRFLAAFVKEPFEKQIVFEWADVGDAEKIGDDRPTSGTARGAGDSLIASASHEVPDDQKVARIAHLFDDAEFEIEPIAVLLRDVVLVTPDEAFFAKFAQVLSVREFAGWAKDGIVLRVFKLDIAAVGDLLAPRHGVGV